MILFLASQLSHCDQEMQYDGWLLWRCKLTRPDWRRPRREMRDMICIEFESNQRDADADPTSGGLL
jgi:hypothetical protein